MLAISVLLAGGVIVSIVSPAAANLPDVREKKACNCVIFRLDDVQDYFVYRAQLSVMDLFILKNHSLSLGIIMNHIGEDDKIVQKVLEGKQKGLFELALHGWEHNDFSAMSRKQQQSALIESNKKMLALFGEKSQIFIPPMNKFNNNTLTVMNELGLKIISSDTNQDRHRHFAASESSDDVKKGVLHMPAVTGVRVVHQGEWVRVPAEEIISEVQNSISKYGYGVIMMHPQDFVKLKNGKHTQSLDRAQLKELLRLVQLLESKNIKIGTFSEAAGI